MAKASTAALIIAGVVGAPAARAESVPDVKADYTCKFPIVDKQPLSITVSSNIPQQIQDGVVQPPFQVVLSAVAKGDSVRMINTLNAYSLESAPPDVISDGVGSGAPANATSEASADLVFPSGLVQALPIPLAVEPWTRPSPAPLTGDFPLVAKGETPSFVIDELGEASIRLERIKLRLLAKNAAGGIINVRKLTTDFEGNPVPLDFGPGFDVYCKLNAGQSNVIAQFQVGHSDPIPSQVTGLKSTAKSPTTIDLAWDAPSDVDTVGAEEYNVYQGGTLVKRVASPATSTQITGLTPDTEYSFSVAAVGGFGEGQRSTVLKAKTDALVPPNQPPTVPTALKVGTVTSSTIALSWTASQDDVKVAGYNVYGNGVKIGTSVTPSYTATGLAPSTTYQFAVEAFDEPGLTSGKTAPVSAGPIVDPGTCPDGFACQGYTLAGSTQLKTLTTGTLPLKGGIDAQLNVSDGKFTADLVLNPTTGRLTAGGFLPITVKISFAPSGKTTGLLDDANILRSKSLVRIKVSEVKLFGAIPLAGGNGCQTKSLSEINLTSTKAFEIFKGGTLKGTYAISDLNGCGVLNGIVSPLTAGGGNTISLDLTPKA